MTDPETTGSVRRRVSRLSDRELRRIAMGTRSGKRLAGSISAQAEREVRNHRARRQAISYIPWALAAAAIMALMAILGFGSPGMMDKLTGTGASATSTNAWERVDEDVALFREPDGAIILYVHDAPGEVQVNRQPVSLEKLSGWSWLDLGKVDGVTIVREGRESRYNWGSDGWQKVN